jgi:hypothetical protein
MTDVSKMFESDSHWMKAADHDGMNKQLTIKDTGTDTISFDGQPDKDIVWIQLDKAPKPIILSLTNGRTLVGAFGGDIEGWKQKRVLLTTKEYDIEGKKSVGWITTPLLEEDPDDDIPF